MTSPLRGANVLQENDMPITAKRLRDRVEEIDLDAERRHRAIDEVYERQYGANRAAWDA